VIHQPTVIQVRIYFCCWEQVKKVDANRCNVLLGEKNSIQEPVNNDHWFPVPPAAQQTTGARKQGRNKKKKMSEEESASRKKAKKANEQSNKVTKRSKTAAPTIEREGEHAAGGPDQTIAGGAAFDLGNDVRNGEDKDKENESVAQAPGKMRKSRDNGGNSDVMQFLTEGRRAGYEGRKMFDVEGFGCVHCSLQQLKDKEYVIRERSYLEAYQKPGGLLYETVCQGKCGKNGGSLLWKERNKHTNVLAYYCNIRMNERKEEPEKNLPFCPWWCEACFLRDWDIEHMKWAEQEGEDPEQAKRPRRGRS
jgi:hypothetical protein